MSCDALVVSDVIYVAPQPDWSFPIHNHEREVELSYVMAGAGTFFHDNRTRTVREGMLVVKNAGLSHAEHSDPDNPLEQLCVSVRGVCYEGLPEGHVIPDDADPLLELGEDRELVAACFSFLRDHAGDVDYESLCGKAMGLVLDLVRLRCSRAGAMGGQARRGGEELVAGTTAYLDRHFREKVRIRDLASHLFTSEGNLSRQFKRVTGYTVNEYVVSKRMGEAQRLLMFGDDDIKEVARACGYDSVQYFYHVFAEHAHCTPAEFRRRYRG